MKDFRGKLVLVTGGAQGIGKGLASKLAARGARLVLTDVRDAELQATAEELRGRGTPVATYRVDVTDEQAVVSLQKQVRADVGPIDVLVNNAGVVFGGPFLEVPLERHRLTYAVNSMGVVAMTHAFLPDLIGRPDAHLVNIASASGLIGLPFGATYASSKWAVIGFSESIRLELAELGHKHVKVTTVCPSYIATGMFKGVRPPLLTPMLTPESLVEKMVQAVEREELFLLEPPMVKTLPLLNGLLPKRVFDVVAARFGLHDSMKQWRGH